VYMLHAVCEFSSFGYYMTVRTHGIDDWLTFVRRITLDRCQVPRPHAATTTLRLRARVHVPGVREALR
jgi:hypothetical protein